MADDWIKMRTALCTDPKIDEIASILNGSDDFRRALCRGEGDPGPLRPTMLRHLVVGAMHAFWTRMQEITVSGSVPQVSPGTMDDCLDIPGLTAAMTRVGWLEATQAGGIVVPNWDAHNSESAKKRALEARKKRLQRQNDDVPQVSRTCPAVFPETMDDCLDIPGVTAAMTRVGSIEATEAGDVVVPNRSESAKKRALEARKARKKRLQRQNDVPQVSRKCPASVPEKRRPEKRREEKSKKEGSKLPKKAAAVAADPSFDSEQVAKAWRKASKKGGLRPLVTFGRTRQERVQALASVPVFCQRWAESIERASKTPFCTGGGDKGWRMSFDSWLKHWSDVLEGKYDDAKPVSAADSKGILDRLEQAGAITR